MIMGFNTSFSVAREKFKDIDKRFDVRPESSFSADNYKCMTTGKGSWRKRVIEEMSKK